MAKLKDELGKRDAFDSLQQEATLAIVRTADRLQLRFARLFRSFGVTAAQYNVLRILRGHGRPMPILEISRQTIAVVPGITGLVDRLEQVGWVERQRCPEDRRVIRVALTVAGSALLAKLDRPVLELHQEVMGGVSAAELSTLNRILEAVRERSAVEDADVV